MSSRNPAPAALTLRVQRHRGRARTVLTGWYQAALLGLDGVVTDTANLHFLAWAESYAAFVTGSPAQSQLRTRPVTVEDYESHLKGRSRLDGAVALINSRGAATSDAIAWARRLAAEKDRRFEDLLGRRALRPLPDGSRLLERLATAGLRVAVVSGMRQGRQVIETLHLQRWLTVVVDGVVADDLHLPGTPHPALFLEAAARLNEVPERCVVIEGTTVGVEAAKRGGFGLVIALDRIGAHADALIEAGASVVVRNLDEIEISATSA